MNGYRNEVKKVGKEVPFTLWTLLKWGIPTIIVVAILLFLAQSMGIISMNIQRETTQHSQQYVETKVNLLNKLLSDWSQLDTEIVELKAGEGNEDIITAKKAQQKNVVKRIHTEAGMIPSSQIPSDVKTFMAEHPR